MDFKPGDIIKGKKDNGYGFTNERMTKAEVLETKDNCMEIRVIEHKDREHIDATVRVKNTDTKFQIVKFKKITKKELLDMPIGTKITTDEKEDNIYIYDEDIFSNKYGCIKDSDIEEDLTINNEHCEVRIIKVEQPEYKIIYDYSTEIKEMTIKEIEEKLGYEIKIVKEDK